MAKNAMKSTNESDIVFAWSEQDCQALGIERRDAILAWKAVQGLLPEKVSNADLLSMGYDGTTEFDNIILLPNYARALRVMLTQWLNVVGLPEAARTHYNMMRSAKAPEAVRVKAAKHLTDMAETMRASFIDEYAKPIDEMDPDTLARVIRQLEKTKAIAIIDNDLLGQIDGQTAEADTYLSDLL